MDESLILRKASELGFMIHETRVYREYDRLSSEIEKDPDLRMLLEDYGRLAMEISTRERSGAMVEDFEKDELRELVERIHDEEKLVEFLRARDLYIALLDRIRVSLTGGEDDATG